MSMSTLTIQLPYEQKRELMRIAEESDLTVSQLIRSFVRAVISNAENHSKPQIEFSR